jgi:Na+-driven multidrug efflux pump
MDHAVLSRLDHPPVRELLRRILALAAPTTLVVLLQAGGQLAETWLAARQGTTALSAWAVVLPFALMLQQMSAGAMGGGVVSAIARTLGGGNREEAADLVLHALIIAGTAAGIFMFLLAGIPAIVLGAIAGPAIAATAAPYALWLFGAGAIPAWAANTLASVMRGGGRHALAARVLICSGALYPPLAWLLMEPLGQGLPGAGMAFALTNACAALALGALVARGGAGFRPHLRIRLRWELFRRILAVGLIASMLAVIANATTILVTAQLSAYGVAAVAAYGISARLEFLMIPLSFGVGSALTALVGRAVGARDWPTARRTAWTGGLLTLVIAGSVGIAVGLFPAGFAGAFASDPAVASIAARGLRFTGPAFGGFGLGMAMYFASLGAGRMLWPFFAAASRFILAVGGGWLLGNHFGIGIEGYFIAVAAGITAYGGLTAAGVRQAVWRG